MAVMRLMLAPLGIVLVSLALVGCNGGGGEQGAANKVTDPARVPSSTPVQNPTLYKISGDKVSTTGGSPVAVTPTGGSSGGGAGSYVVKSGDTCGSIAAKYNITVDELLKANRTIDSNCSNLRIDDTLRIPSAVGTTTATPRPGGTTTASGTRTPTPGSGSGRTYTVRSGDTCGAIAANQGVDVGALISLNGLDANCANLQIGQVLRIP